MEAPETREESDRCPYPRPFAPEFADCPTFEPVTFIAADSSHRPLQPAITCRHLTTGNSGEAGRFYPRCGLGTLAARLRWRSEVGAARFEHVRQLQVEFDAATRDVRERLLVAKADLVASRFAHDERTALERLLTEFLADVEAFLRAREQRYVEAGMTVEEQLGLVQQWTRAWAPSSEVALDEVSR